MKLTLDACKTLGEIDLGDLVDEEGDLGATGGNLYLYIDGVEYGSLWFHRQDDGTVEIVLGQMDLDAQEWTERNPLDRTVDDTDTDPKTKGDD